MITPIIRPILVYHLDDFDYKLNWRVRCGAPFLLSSYNARMTFWPTKVDRTAPIYQITNPQTGGNGIALADASPNIWAHIIDTNVNFISDPPLFYVFELQTPVGLNPAIDGVWFRLLQGSVDYIE